MQFGAIRLAATTGAINFNTSWINAPAKAGASRALHTQKIAILITLGTKPTELCWRAKK
jgi:hypothetical protein